MKKLIFGLTLCVSVVALAKDPCSENNAKAGTVCDGGSIFVGVIKNQRYMTTPLTGPISQWGSLETHTGVVDPDTGLKNTEKLASLSPPADYCFNLESGGYSDWFLPAENELMMLLGHASEIGGFSSDWYWSSTECPVDPNLYPVTVRGSSATLGRITNLLKSWDGATRCVRTAKP